MALNLATDIKITWCPGCPNSQILVAFRQAVTEMVDSKELEIHNLVAGAGVGCHGKISDYLRVNTFNGLHGRIIPVLTGVKVANPELTVVGFSGDGDSFSEGLSHICHAAQRNSDISIFLHNNQTFALTTGQATTTSPVGFKGGTTPYGSVDEPWSPTLMMLASGATFVARTFASNIQMTKQVMQEAMRHKGFAFVDIIQPCITFFDTREFYSKRVKDLPKNYKPDDLAAAIAIARELLDKKVHVGILYRTDKPTFEEKIA
jgi:2-oxoglutarate/2-oxoacid ferredoxin oxidoreductase subunit beta